jgi:hypothetical protein
VSRQNSIVCTLGAQNEKHYARWALFNTVSLLVKITIQACRGMREEQPEAILQDMFKLMPKFVRK